MKIIDRTLSSIKFSTVSPSAHLLSEMCVMLSKMGADFIEITPEIFKYIENLPDGVKYILKVSTISEATEYRGFERYIIKAKGNIDFIPVINEIQINDVREIDNLQNLSGIKNACITGLDDVLLGDYKSAFKRIISIFGNNVYFCPQNDYNCATAIATEWLMCGGKNIAVSFAGVGNYAALEQVIMTAKIAMHQKVGVDLKGLQRAKEIYEHLSGLKVAQNKPIIGSKIFAVESGVHVDAIEKNTNIYEPFCPSSVGLDRSIIIGKHSGTTAIKVKAKSFDVLLTNDEAVKFLIIAKQKSYELNRSLTDEEFKKVLGGQI